MRFGILGPLEIASDDGTAVAWRGAKRRGLLSLLLVHRGAPLTVDRIVDDLWGETSGSGAANTVQTYLSQLRRVLEGQTGASLVRRGNGYALDVEAGTFDADRFERLLRDARSVDDPVRVCMLREALAQWRGDALEEFRGAPWADTAAQRLESKRVEAHERLMRSELALGRGPELVAELETLTARYPLHEALLGHLMVALYRAHRQADALQAYRQLRERLRDELGIDPSHAVAELERRVLEQDETLLASPPEPGATAPRDRARPEAHDRATVGLHDASYTVGRDAELGRLEAMVAAARSGQPRLAVIRGDIGIGKTRLVCDLIDHCPPDVVVHVVPCPAFERQSFLTLVGELAPPGAPADDALDVFRDGSLDGPGVRDDAEWQTLRNRVFAALRRALERDDATTLLVVEDVHWADQATLEFLDDLGAYFASRTEPVRVAAIATRRAFGADEDVDAVTARLEKLSCALSVRLRPLHELDVHELLRAAGIDHPARGLVRLLYERSRGNPLYVTEALRRLEHLDAFVDRDGYVGTDLAPAELAAPADLQQLVDHRVAELDAELADALSVAALCGDTIDIDLLAELTGYDHTARLAAIVGRGLLVEDRGTFRFAHQLVVAALRDRLAPERRRILHRSIAEALRARRDRGAPVAATMLGRHIVDGGLRGLDPNVIRDLWNAGRVASRVAEWGEAARMFEAALAVGEDRSVDPRALAWMRYWAGRCHEHDYDVERALTRYREAAVWGRDHGDIDLWGAAALAAGTRVVSGNADVFEQALDVSDIADVLPHVDDSHPKLRCRLVRKYAEVQMQLSRFDDACALATDALELARSIDDAALEAECASTLAYGHIASGSATVALELLRDLDRRALDERPESEGFLLARLGIAALMLGDLDTADAAVSEAGAVFDSVRHRAGSSLAEALAANLALLHGDLDAAEQRGRRAYELFLVSQYFLVLPILFSVLSETRFLRDDARGVAETVADWNATGQRGADLLQFMSIARGTERRDHELTDLAGYAGLLTALTAPSVLAPSMSAIAAEVAFATHDAPLAERVLANIDAMPDPQVQLGPGFPYTLARTRGMLLETMHRYDDALVAYRDALHVAGIAHIPIEVARAELAIASVLSTRHPGDAARHAEASRSIAERHGFIVLAKAAHRIGR